MFRRSSIAAGILQVVCGLTSTACITHAQATAQTRHPAGKTSAEPFAVLAQRASQALDADNLDEAVPLLRRALKIKPGWVEGWWSLGTASYDQSRYAEASLAFQKVLALQPRHGTAHAMLGLCQFELGDDDAALKNISESRALGTDLDAQLRDVIQYHEGVLLRRKGQFAAAQKPLASLCLGGSRDPQVVRAFGMAALRMRDRHPPAPGSREDSAVEMVGRASCMAAHKDFQDARRVFEQAVADYADIPYVHFAFGGELVDAREVPDAIEQFRIEANAAQGGAKALSLLQIAAAEYKVDSAAGLLYAQQAVKLSPRAPFAHFLLGLLLMDTGKYAEAVPELELARTGMPHEPKVLWSLAAAYGHVGRTKEASVVRGEFLLLNLKEHDQEASENPDVPVNTGDSPDGKQNP